MAQLGDLITQLANAEQDRAIKAVLDALQETGLVVYVPELGYYRIRSGVIAAESLAMSITNNLRKP